MFSRIFHYITLLSFWKLFKGFRKNGKKKKADKIYRSPRFAWHSDEMILLPASPTGALTIEHKESKTFRKRLQTKLEGCGLF